MSDPTKCPECVQGKHPNCSGDAYDFDADRPVPCMCATCAHVGPADDRVPPVDVRPADGAGEAQREVSDFAWEVTGDVMEILKLDKAPRRLAEILQASLTAAEVCAAKEARATHAIDAAHIDHQRAWSEATFGPGVRLGVLDHIRKELDEVAEDPTCLEEWVDVIILGLDGAWRGGHDSQAIVDAIKAKQAKNEARSWPDWREVGTDKAIEHVRLPDCQCVYVEPHRPHDWASLAHRWHCEGRTA